MQHRLFVPVIFAAALAAAGSLSPAFAADPSGIWAKEDGSAKMEVTKCGAGICSKIVWLQSPNDSRGQPLRDGRNENISLRGRPIMGLPIFKLAPAGPNVWTGPVYNPEEGRIYNDVKVTLVSSRQIVLRGCKAMLFCGEKTWTRTSPPPSLSPAEEPAQIEAQAPANEQADTDTAEVEAQGRQTAEAAASLTQIIAPGVVATSAKTEPLALSGEDVPSMMVMNKPAADAASKSAATETTPPPPARAPEAAAAAQPAPVNSKAPSRVADRGAEAPEAQAETKPKAPVRQVQQEPRERLPWERPQGYVPSYLGFEGAPPPPRRGLFGGLFR